MLRKFVFALLAFGVVTVGLMADEFTGKVKSVDPDKNTIVVANKEGEKTFTVDKDTKFVRVGKDGTSKDITDGIKGKAFANQEKLPRVVVTFEKKGDKEVVSEVKIPAGRGKGKGKGGDK
ncbi:hypothetical protein BH10PLA2_BH10PLA2_37990 [soil metagenome]